MRRKLVVGGVCLMALMILPGAVFAADVIDALFVTADSVADATPQEGGYRSSAAAAKFSRVCAAKYYGYGEGAVRKYGRVTNGRMPTRRVSVSSFRMNRLQRSLPLLQLRKQPRREFLSGYGFALVLLQLQESFCSFDNCRSEFKSIF